MRGNVPIPEIPHGEDLWLIVLVTSVRERRTQQGRLFYDATARNASGTLALKIWGEVIETQKEIKPGLWGITGKLETFQDRQQFVVAEYRPITIEQYREHQNSEPKLPRAYTLDIETLTLPNYRERVGSQLEVSSLDAHTLQAQDYNTKWAVYDRLVSYDDSGLRIGFPRDMTFNKKKADSPERRDTLAAAFAAVTGVGLRPTFVILEGEAPPDTPAPGSEEIDEEELLRRLKSEFDAEEVS